MSYKRKQKRLGKIAIGKVQQESQTISGNYEAEKQKLLSMSQSMGVSFDGNNQVISNSTNDDIASMQDTINAQQLQINDLISRVEALENP